jgi:uncharacterized protein (TIGR02246 family)
MKRFFLTLPLLLTLISTYAPAQTTPNELTPSSRELEEKRIKELLTSSVDAWNHHDANAFSMVFAEDADFTNVLGRSAHGRTEIEKFHAPMFATMFKDSHLTITDVKIRFITSDVAAVDARWEMTGAKSRDGQDIPLRKGLLNFLMTRSNGQWLITVMHNMDLPPQ